MRPLVIAAVLSAGLLHPAAAEASCAIQPPSRDRLAEADAAFVGTAVRSTGTPERPAYVFRVEKSYKGALGAEVEVRDEYGVSSISLDPKPNQTIGLLLQQDSNGYFANDCDRIPPEGLE